MPVWGLSPETVLYVVATLQLERVPDMWKDMRKDALVAPNETCCVCGSRFLRCRPRDDTLLVFSRTDEVTKAVLYDKTCADCNTVHSYSTVRSQPHTRAPMRPPMRPPMRS